MLRIVQHRIFDAELNIAGSALPAMAGFVGKTDWEGGSQLDVFQRPVVKVEPRIVNDR